MVCQFDVSNWVSEGVGRMEESEGEEQRGKE